MDSARKQEAINDQLTGRAAEKTEKTAANTVLLSSACQTARYRVKTEPSFTVSVVKNPLVPNRLLLVWYRDVLCGDVLT